METFQCKRNICYCNAVEVCATTREQFVKEIFALPTTPVSATVDFIGVPAVVAAKEDPVIANVYSKCTFAAMDGMPLVKLAKKQGIKCERCAGPDVMKPIFIESIKKEKTHYFYGGKNDEVLKKLKENLERDYPGIQIVGMYSPPFRPLTIEEENKICAEITSCNPDFLWVGIGAPKQEIWMQEHRDKIPNTVMLGVGAAFNFYAGVLDKAPEWIENMNLEWFYRLIKEPKRLWKRYIIGGVKWIYYNIKSR